MTDLRSLRKITEFVRGTLGCTCPDSVFEKIETGSVDVGDVTNRATRLVIGDTLLLYVVVPGSMPALVASLPELAELGRRDRNTHCYNRFRLVVADDGDSRLHETAAVRFAEVAGGDEKMHIHFVTPAAVSGY